MKRFEFVPMTSAAVTIVLALGAEEAPAGPIGPTPYLQASDSPIAPLAFDYDRFRGHADLGHRGINR